MRVLYIIVPCYNEGECLPQTAPRLRQKLAGLIEKGVVDPQSRVLLVDDGSADDTWEIIRALHEKDELFSGLRLSPNRGHQNAVMAGLMEAMTLADVTVSIDADLQDDMDAIDEMLEKHGRGYHIVCGVRNSRATDTFFKRTTARGYYALMNLFGAKIIFDHADFRLMDKAALEKLSYYHGDDLFLRGLATRLGMETATVTYDRTARAVGESKYTLGKMMKLALRGFTCGRCKPEDTPRPPDPHITERLYA
ncbi:MAG: glycosyltransferase family 2 protein [Oscillospiraceae bacterium]|nr:glycosyltransferase family 2 protein [Oscillospiraceae bacterium]